MPLAIAAIWSAVSRGRRLWRPSISIMYRGRCFLLTLWYVPMMVRLTLAHKDSIPLV